MDCFVPRNDDNDYFSKTEQLSIMIHHLEGKLSEKTPTYAIIDVNGVGYLLLTSLNTSAKLVNAEKCKLYVEQLYIRDDNPKYYGFADTEERNLFRLLVSVSGVGGNSALLMLSSLSGSEIQAAILTGNVALIKSVKGIGEKTAQRIIVDLKDKIGKVETSSEFSFAPKNNILKDEALSALTMLGFNKAASDKVLDKIMKQEGAGLSVEQLIKAALKNL
jgi:holliday junction DNA helicase RuvA